MYELKHNALFTLDNLGLIKVGGNKPEAFLQGQLSCDVNKVSTSQMQPSALCNLQGRVLALLDVLQWQGLQILMPKSLMESVKKTLSKVALVSRVILEESLTISIYGFYLANKKEMSPLDLPLPANPFEQCYTDEACMYSLGGSYYIVLVLNENKVRLEAPFIKEQQIYDATLWHKHQLQRMRFEIYPQTQAQFLPHRVELHKRAHISFDKGCYRGQEIIARTQYRAKIKHGLALFLVDNTTSTLSPGLKIFSATKQGAELGELIDFCLYSDDHLLVLVSILFEHPNEVIFEGHSTITQLVSIAFKA